jgi:transposase
VKANRVRNLGLVTASTLVVGVDGHSKSNTAGFRLASFAEPARPLKFPNSRCGFDRLLTKVKSVMSANELDEVLFVLEPNGPYWLVLAHFLCERGYVVRVVSPLQVKRNRQTEDVSPEKNDNKDARSISDLGVQGKFNQTTLVGPVYEQLRLLSMLRERLTVDRSAYKHVLRSLMARSFPELCECTKDVFCKSILALLRVAPTAGAVSMLGAEGVAEVIKVASKGRFGLKKAREIVRAACESIGYLEASDAIRVEFDVIVSMVEDIQEKIEALGAEMSRLLMQSQEGELILSIPGIGLVTAAAFVGEVGGLSGYSSPSQICKLAGLDLVKQQSSDYCSATRISKRGRRLLRKTLYQMALGSLMHDSKIMEFYQSLIAPTRPRRLKKKQALVAVMGKLVRVIFSVVRSSTPYDPQYAWAPPGQESAELVKAA